MRQKTSTPKKVKKVPGKKNSQAPKIIYKTRKLKNNSLQSNI
jgi:hypothetical protein